MIVDNALYRAGKRVAPDRDDAELEVRRLSHEPGDFQWLGIFNPDARELEALAREFDLHPLAVEDSGESHQRPKLEAYGDHVFVVLKTLWYVDADDAVETGEINIFIGPDYVITIRHGDGSQLQESRRDLEQRAQVLSHGPSAVLYAVCDHVVDEYERVGAELEVDVDEVEEAVFSPGPAPVSARIYTLKRELAEVRRAVMPLREPMRRFAAGDHPGLDPDAATYFRDVADHLQRVSEVIDNLDALLSTAFEAYLARIQVQQNEDMRKISAGAALVVVPTLIAGVYGMNYELWPSNSWAGGFWFALALMLASAGGLWVFFKRAGWF
ncbi:magnesium and cobalt transport protein CorA [Nocardioides seonyuensis]|uniref:Magnesium and cobalt transport protein CorA n=1 Tax=Nocardioides seonyuensis TaxID=2518371 RepID=A0A4P7IID5_9ACTN|nr:magnesium and cobalt transport protein CorA [Nocardioides seonyuensis]QBX57098.1 magnesium and cobalt transport protein CorA [Nocardioides seonyuensis]